ncbi:hypothetical protein HY750_02305 [Candidatus Kuenenbacteria bacterium]|nr:hypothetical protein [Candidatus Kuenenbacteria bacterium]
MTKKEFNFLIYFDEAINKNFNLEKDFDKDSFQNFLDLAGIKTSLNCLEVLRNLKLLDDNNKMKNAGVLLFCKEATRHLRSATITCALFMGKTKTKIIDSREFDFDLYINYKKAFNYFKSNLRTEYIIKGGGLRKEILELPEEALKEALLNAIAHRNYFSGSNI